VRVTVGLLACVFLLIGCGGGGSKIRIGAAIKDAEMGGVYGIHFVTAQGFAADATLLISEDNEFVAFENPTLSLDGIYMRGSLNVNRNSFSGTGYQIAPPGFEGFTLYNGQVTRRVSVRIQGTVNSARRDIEGTFSVDGISNQGSFRANASTEQVDLYQAGSSIDQLAGGWQDVRTGTLVSAQVDSSGYITGLDPNCELSGQVSIIDAQFNLYDLDITLSNCTALEEGKYDGYVALDEDSSSPILIIAGDDAGEALLVYVMDRI